MKIGGRKYKRFRIPLSMRFLVISGEDKRRFSRFRRIRVWDIGLGGVSILTPVLRIDGLHMFYDLIPTVRNHVMMQIEIPDSGEPITALGQAVQGRVMRIKGRKAYLVGIHFLQISESHGRRLRSYLVQWLKERQGSGKLFP